MEWNSHKISNGYVSANLKTSTRLKNQWLDINTDLKANTEHLKIIFRDDSAKTSSIHAWVKFLEFKIVWSPAMHAELTKILADSLMDLSCRWNSQIAMQFLDMDAYKLLCTTPFAAWDHGIVWKWSCRSYNNLADNGLPTHGSNVLHYSLVPARALQEGWAATDWHVNS